MARTKISPHYSYPDPLLAAMYALTGGQTNVKIRHVDATAKLCELIGTTIDAHGKQDKTNQFWTVRWASLAMLDLKAKGMMDYPAKGWWVLTEAGVKAASVLNVSQKQGDAAVIRAVAAGPDLMDTKTREILGTAVQIVTAAPATKVVKAVSAVVTATPATQPKQGQAGELLEFIPETVAQVVDSYLLGLQMAATVCFGSFSAKSDVCKSCLLAGKCYEGMLTKLALLADDLPLVEAPKPVEVPKPTAPTGVTGGLSPSALPPGVFGSVVKQAVASTPTPTVDLDLDSTPATKVKAKSTGTQYFKMVAAADSQCIHCKGVITKGADAAYSRAVGFVHLACANKGV